MKEELKFAEGKLENALLKLKEGTDRAKDELEEDGVIQRFEFTFELFWKTLKMFLQDKGVEARTPRDVFKEAFRLEWLDKEEVFLDMLEDRNKTSHIYDRETSRQIYARIKKDYVSAMNEVVQRIKSVTKNFE